MKKHKTYKLIVATLLVLIFCAQNFSNVLIVADYYADTKAYAANCINKSKPQMHCNGKCQMQKKLDDTNKDKQSTEHKTNNGVEVLSSKSFFAVINTSPQKIINRKYFLLNINISKGTTAKFFHPPAGFFI